MKLLKARFGHWVGLRHILVSIRAILQSGN